MRRSWQKRALSSHGNDASAKSWRCRSDGVWSFQFSVVPTFPACSDTTTPDSRILCLPPPHRMISINGKRSQSHVAHVRCYIVVGRIPKGPLGFPTAVPSSWRWWGSRPMIMWQKDFQMYLEVTSQLTLKWSKETLCQWVQSKCVSLFKPESFSLGVSRREGEKVWSRKKDFDVL